MCPHAVAEQTARPGIQCPVRGAVQSASATAYQPRPSTLLQRRQELAVVVDDGVGAQLADGARRVAEGDADAGHAGGHGGGDVDLAVAHHHRALDAAADQRDGAGQVAGIGLAHGERVAAGDGAEAARRGRAGPAAICDSASNLLVQTASRAPACSSVVEQLGHALERPADDGDVVLVVGRGTARAARSPRRSGLATPCRRRPASIMAREPRLMKGCSSAGDTGASPIRPNTWLAAAARSGAVSTRVPSRSKTMVASVRSRAMGQRCDVASAAATLCGSDCRACHARERERCAWPAIGLHRARLRGLDRARQPRHAGRPVTVEASHGQAHHHPRQEPVLRRRPVGRRAEAARHQQGDRRHHGARARVRRGRDARGHRGRQPRLPELVEDAGQGALQAGAHAGST